jgi:hypothetical protein
MEVGSLSCAGAAPRSRPPALRDGSGASRAFVPAAGAQVAKRPAAHETIGLPGVRDPGVGPAGAGARQALGASVPPHLTIIHLAHQPWQGISSPSGGKVPSGSRPDGDFAAGPSGRLHGAWARSPAAAGFE